MMLLKKLSLWISILLLLLVSSGYWGYRDLRTPHTHTANEELIVIETGMSKRTIIRNLVEKGILARQFPTLIYLAFYSKNKLQAGEYRFESPITPLEVVDKLQKGIIVSEQVTIPEGYDQFDLLEALVTAKIDSREALQTALKDRALIADLDSEARDLEGYLFPDTYSYTSRTRAGQFIATMVKRCRQIFTPERQARARELGLSIRQLMTLASLVEREAKIDTERPIIAAVFYNRLKRNMRLDCDPTFIYAAKLIGRWDNNVNNPAHRRSTSPYNTYFVTGLPPGPITSPGVKSIDAVLYPAKVDYLYFVANGIDGGHRFSRTEAQHLAAVAAYYRQVRQSGSN